MSTRAKRAAETAVLLAILYGARRYFRNWGATKSESQMLLPGDTLVADPAIQTTEAVYIDAPAAAVWTWLVQMARDRGGFYGCARPKNLEGFRHRDVDQIHAEWQQLEKGDRVRLSPEGWIGSPDGVTATVADVVPEKYLVLNATQEDQRWNAVWSFHIQPHWEDRARMLTRVRIGLRHPGEVFGMELARPVVAFGTRALLLGIKHRTERSIERTAMSRKQMSAPDPITQAGAAVRTEVPS